MFENLVIEEIYICDHCGHVTQDAAETSCECYLKVKPSFTTKYLVPKEYIECVKLLEKSK